LREYSGYSWAGSLSRWCTTRLKTEVINSYFKNLNNNYRVIHCVGIASDEQYRLQRKNNSKDNQRHPLVEWEWTEADALGYCYDRGFDWEGLYKLFARVSCWCCPLQPLEELRTLRKHFPDLWEELKDMDRRTWRKFKPDYSVDELEIRFAFEEERLAEGLPINNRDFFNKLKERLKGSGEDA
jgi:3'-phosphoadenosine 5'-phosphosulfate sulfotransferase (PAPS reductase)/FAD synthetase